MNGPQAHRDVPQRAERNAGRLPRFPTGDNP